MPLSEKDSSKEKVLQFLFLRDRMRKDNPLYLYMSTLHTPTPVGSTLVVIGNGQLGRMLCPAAHRLGFKTCVISDQPKGCAFDVTSQKVVTHHYRTQPALEHVTQSSVVTAEFENVPLHFFDALAKVSPTVFPGHRALKVAQDRRLEKQLAVELGISGPEFWIIESEKDLGLSIEFPVILKIARNGYDGKGQKRVENKSELEEAWRDFGCVPCVTEEIVDYASEFSIILARSRTGEIAYYLPFQNTHERGILRSTIWPAPNFSASMINDAHEIARAFAENLQVVGLLAVEMFYTKDGQFLFNELAPRPHNSGHVTLDCAVTSQFEQHIRAITGLPLGNTDPMCRGRMFNVIGEPSPFEEALRHRMVRIYNYNKEPRENRKLGHLTHLSKL